MRWSIIKYKPYTHLASKHMGESSHSKHRGCQQAPGLRRNMARSQKSRLFLH